MNKELEWQNVKKRLRIGQIVTGKVKSHEVYGIYVDIGFDFPCFVDRINISDAKPVSMNHYPKIGDEISGIIIGLSELKNNDNTWREIILDIRPSQLKMKLGGSR